MQGIVIFEMSSSPEQTVPGAIVYCWVGISFFFEPRGRESASAIQFMSSSSISSTLDRGT